MEQNGCDYDSINDDRTDRSFKRMKMENVDIKAFEINSGRHTLKRIVEEPNLGNLPKDGDCPRFPNKLLLKSEPSSSLNESGDFSDGKKDMDPQYKMFLENSRADGLLCKLGIPMKNRTVSVMYEGENHTYDDCDMHSLVKNKDDQIIENSPRKERENEKRNSKPSGDKLRNCSSRFICNDIRDSIKYNRNKLEGEVQNFVKEDFKSRGVKDLKNIRRRKKVETLKQVEKTSMDMESNSGRRKKKLPQEKNLKSKGANLDHTKTDKFSGVFGFDWQHELNGKDVDECYRNFLNSSKIEGDCVVYVVKQEALDVVCSYDSEVLVTSNASKFDEDGRHPFQFRSNYLTPENEQQCLGSNGDGFASEFRNKLIEKIGEPYDDREYKKLWLEFNKERPKVKHFDLRGSGAVKSFPVGELSPSYFATYSLLSRKIDAAGHDHLRLNFLRGFFFWLQNVAHEDAFEPWLDKSFLEVMQKIC